MNWRNWDRDDWNVHLLRAVFGVSERGEGPVRTIDVTPSFLASVAKEPSDSEDSIQERFLDCYRVEPKQARALFDERVQIPHGSVPTPDEPRFFGQLYFSCITASATEVTQDEGNFRKRLATHIGLDTDADYLSRRGLAPLWKALADWTERSSEAGRPFRPLVLPDPGHETIIGYSKGLAFPTHKDLSRLVLVVGENELSEDSPVSEILAAVESSGKRFSNRFRSELDRFRRALRSPYADPSETLFWSAFQAATWKPPEEDRQKRPGLVLSLRIDSVAELECFATAGPAETGPWLFLPFPTESDGYRGQVTLANGESIVRRVLDGEGLKGFRLGHVRRLAKQGCIPFGSGESVSWLSRPALPSMGSSWLLLRRDRAGFIGSILKNKIGSLDRIDVAGVPNWVLTGPIPRADADRLTETEALRRYGAFQRSLGVSSIRLRDSIRIESSSYLFLPPRLPRVCASRADRVSIFRHGDSELVGHLVRDPDDPECWRFPASIGGRAPTPGEILITARAGGDVVGSRKLRIVGFCSTVARDPELPPGRFAAETRFGQIGSIDDLSEDPLEELTFFDDRLPEGYPWLRDLVRERPSISSGSDFGPVCRWRSIDSVPEAWWDILEVCHALSLNRAGGLSWEELVEVSREGFRLEHTEQAKAVAQNLVQNGSMRKLYSLQSPGFRYLAPPPQILRTTEPCELRVSGILGKMGLAELRRWATERQARLEVAVLRDFEAIGVLRIVSFDRLSAAELEGILGPVSSDHVVDPLPSPSGVLSHTSRRIDLAEGALETHPWGTRSPRMRELGVTVETRRFGDRPNRFVFSRNGLPFWATQSFSWAVLIARLICEGEPWRIDDAGTLSLSHAAPPIFGRRTLARGGGVCGALWKSSKPGVYLYPIGSGPEARQWLGDWARRESLDTAPNLARWVRSIQESSKVSDARRSAFERRYLGLREGVFR